MTRLPIQDLPAGIALHTIGFPLRTKVYRDEGATAPRLSAWIDHRVTDATRILTDLEAGRLPRGHPYHSARAGIAALILLESWLRSPAEPPQSWPALALTASPAAPGAPPAAAVLALTTTDHLAAAAALIAGGFLASGGLRNAGDGTHAALTIAPVSAIAHITRDQADDLLARYADPLCTHPLSIAHGAARNWVRFRLTSDPSSAREFTVLLRGVGTRGAVVSRSLLDDTTPYREIRLPDGTTRRVRNRFRDQMLRHLRGFAASEVA